MADPTQANRSALASIIPKGTPIGQSIAAQEARAQEQLAIDEANNLVMQRDPVSLPEEALNVVDPIIPEPQVQEAQLQISKPASQGPSPASVSSSLPGQVKPQGTAEMEAIVNKQEEGADRLISEADKFHKQAEDDARAKVARTEEAIARTKKVVDEDYQKVKDFKFDDRSVFSKASTGQKIGLMLGAFFSSLSPDSAKSFRDGVQNSVDRDIDAQKQELLTRKEKLGSSQTELGKLTARLEGNVDAASDVLKSRIYHGIALKAQIQEQTAKSRLVVENAKAARTEAYNAALMHQQQAAAKMAEKSSKSAVPGWNGEIPDATDRRNFKAVDQSGRLIKQQIQQLRKITAQNGKSLSPTARADAEVAVGAITSQLKGLETLGTLDKGVQDLVKMYVGNPTDVMSLDKKTLAKLNAFEKYIDNRVSAAAQSNGVTRVNSEIGRVK